MRLNAPTHCDLWDDPELVERPMKERFDLLEVYEDESHHWRYLLECRKCGQRYFYEFFEMVDFVDGEDPQYVAYFPVETEAEIEMLKDASVIGILAHYPRIQKDDPKEGERFVGWVVEE